MAKGKVMTRLKKITDFFRGGRPITDIFRRKRTSVDILDQTIQLQEKEDEKIKAFMEKEKAILKKHNSFEAYFRHVIDLEKAIRFGLETADYKKVKKYEQSLREVKEQFKSLMHIFEQSEEEMLDTGTSFTTQLLALDRKVTKLHQDLTNRLREIEFQSAHTN